MELLIVRLEKKVGANDIKLIKNVTGKVFTTEKLNNKIVGFKCDVDSVAEGTLIAQRIYCYNSGLQGSYAAVMYDDDRNYLLNVLLSY